MAFSATVDLDVSRLPTFQKEVQVALKKALPRWRTNIRAKLFGEYAKQTNEQGLRTISKFFSTSTQLDRGGMGFTLSVDPQKGGKFGKEVQKWDSIAFQSETGITPSGSRRIFPRQSKLLAIPVHPDAKKKDGSSKSPRQFPSGVWINSDGVPLFIRKKGRRSSASPRRPKRPLAVPTAKKGRPKTGIRMQTKGEVDVLFIGASSVNVREAKWYFRNTLDAVFGTGSPNSHMGFPTDSFAFRRLETVLTEAVNRV